MSNFSLLARGMLNRNMHNARRYRSALLNKLTLPTITFIIFYLCILVGGGTSRTDSLSLLYVRPIAIISVMVYFIKNDIIDLNSIKTPLLFLLFIAVIIIFQILPLPFPYWKDIPGHEVFADADGYLGGWRSISISPDRTLNSLVSLVVPLAALIATHHFSQSKKFMVSAFIVGGLISGAAAMAQLALGDGNALYLYRLTTSGAVGLFSNPNHQAVMLACLIPMIALWLADSSKNNLRRDFGAVSLLCLILVLVMITGSRSGLAASLVGLLCAFALHDAYSPRRTTRMRRRYRIFYFSACVGAGAIAVLAMALGRNLAVIRLLELNAAGDLRVADFHLFLQLAKEYFPFGSGAGTFDPAFRMIEPASIIKKTYVNHAHNELIETVITLGLPGLSMIIAFIGWFLVSMISVLKVPYRHRDGYAMLGGALIAIMMLASLTDYLLRTPLMGALFAVACAWLSMGSIAAKDARQPERSHPDRRRTSSKFQDDLVS